MTACSGSFSVQLRKSDLAARGPNVASGVRRLLVMARNVRSGGPQAQRREDPSGRGGWRRAATFMVLPAPVVETMFARAGKWGIEEGGRFEPRRQAVLLWSTAGRRPPARLIGAFAVRWNYPMHGFAVIHLVAWNEANGGSLAEICRAIELLAGVAWDEPNRVRHGR